MTTRITGAAPNCIGDLPSFVITYTPPASAPSATPSAVNVSAIKGDGSAITATAASGSGLSWTWTAAAAIDMAGPWRWRIVASGSLVDATEVAVQIPASKFV